MQSLPDLPLRDIHLPEPLSWWPLAFGWWIGLALVILFIATAGMFLRNKFKINLRKEASKVLDRIEQTFQETGDAVVCLTELSSFLRRAMLSRCAEKIAGVTGKAWLELLDQSLDQPEFSQGVGRILLSGPYEAGADHEEVSLLIVLCRKWVNGL